MDLTIISQLGIALILGMIIGLERGWITREHPQGGGQDGIRNFGLIGLLGALSALLAQQWGTGILGIIFLGLSILSITSYVLTAKKSQDYGTTTEIALLITFVLGALVVRGLAIEAVAVAVIVTWLLKIKIELHQVLLWLEDKELIATLQVLLLATVALPLLPNQDLGPWQAINPRAIGLLVFLIISISYIGYFILRLWQDRAGVLLTGLLGGFASSTATTIVLSRMAKQGENVVKIIAAAIGLANATMSPRLLLVVGLINLKLATQLTLPMLILGLIPLIVGFIIIRQGITHKETNISLKLSNPVELKTAVGYAFILAIFSVFIQGANHWFGNTGVYILATISGLADVDAVTITLSRAVNKTISFEVARNGIFLAVFMNTLVKIVLARIIGGRQLAFWSGLILLGSLGFSALSLLLLRIYI